METSPSQGRSHDPVEEPTVMAREIAEQPSAVRHTLRSLLPTRADLASAYQGRRRVLFVARGSSDNAAVYGRYLLEAYAGVNASLAAPSIATHYQAPLDLSDAVVVAVSQSGATTEIVETAAWARSRGAVIVGVTNVADSPLARTADIAMITAAGPEQAVPATKTYLTQLAAMAVIGDALGADLADSLTTVPDQIERLIDQADTVAPAVAALRDATHTVVSGRGLCLGTALETALKIEETCLRPVRGYSYADLRHGPISVVAPQVAAVLVAAQDGPLTEALGELALDLKRRGATVIGIGGDDHLAASSDIHIPGPDLTERVAPLGLMVPAQLLVERLSVELGLNPDAPRGLAKVTSTDPDSSSNR